MWFAKAYTHQHLVLSFQRRTQSALMRAKDPVAFTSRAGRAANSYPVSSDVRSIFLAFLVLCGTTTRSCAYPAVTHVTVSG